LGYGLSVDVALEFEAAVTRPRTGKDRTICPVSDRIEESDWETWKPDPVAMEQ